MAGTSLAVTTTADSIDGSTSSVNSLKSQPGADGAISLREAITAANNTSGTGAITITFNIPSSDPGYSSASGAWTIAVGSTPQPAATYARALPALARGNVIIDGATQPGSAGHPRIVLDGLSVNEDANGPGLNNGITISSSGNTIRGLTVMRFYDVGVLIAGANAANNAIVGCYLGPSADGGATSDANYYGLEIREGAHDNIIGGTDPASSNLISGNAHSGVRIQDATTRGNSVIGNGIGVAANGQAALANVVAGVLVTGGAHDNTIGGTYPSNLISGNDIGIYLSGAITTTVTGNIIGLDVGGHTPLSNAKGGVLIDAGARGNLVGGTSIDLRNVISGNGPPSPGNPEFGQGVYIANANTINNAIQGNYIGVDDSGNLPAGNYREGVLIEQGAQGNQVGGTADGAGNVIAYNGGGGVRIDGPGNLLAGNLIGVGANGTTQMGNQYNGVRVSGNGNTIGPDNMIVFNQQSGIMLSGSATTVISNTLIENARSGICITGPNNTIRGNTIQSNGSGTGPWTECTYRAGVLISSTNGTLVSDNTISSNDDTGVTVYGGVGNSILSNSITDNRLAGIQLLGGGNKEVAPPRFALVTTSEVSGSACPLCRVEVFTDDGDEGRNFIGATIAANDGTFRQAITPAITPGEHLTATHTDSSGNTSPFAAVVSVPDPTPTPILPPDRPALEQPQQYLPIMRR